ncbi:HIT-like domain-containing protein [Vararia minispora EC-137]|uniref:HIT-like domain-containing protein n=1 Tax=Vararia minispora EC-137 TaxID=1314806 RepID=A0ACB8Q7D2_9AGAM|nr:HIT-like domain-containing protein [Vararia minispora EC-137]
MAGSWQNALRSYATNPDSLPPSVLFSESSSTVTVFDKWPKAIFHFLILPRPTDSLTPTDLADLRTLLHKDKDIALSVLKNLNQEATKVTKDIHKEMRERYGFVWDVHAGFHAVPSVPHIHLHVMSSELVSSSLKNKKHYNSFHPTLGYFISLDTVLSWFDARPETFRQLSSLEESKYTPLLREDLVCFRCNRTLRNIPLLKAHLQEEWDMLRNKGTHKRKADDAQTLVEERPAKKRATSTEAQVTSDKPGP